MAVHPAAIADTNGPIVRLKGKFHGEIIKDLPLGSHWIHAEVPIMGKGVETFFGAIHDFRFLMAWFISEVTGKISFKSTSGAGLLKSCQSAFLISS